MIQRIQSLFLLFSSLFYFLYWYFGFDFYEKGFYPIVAKKLGNISDYFFSFTSYLPLFISIITFVTIFLFKKRILQIRISQVAFYLSIFMVIYTLFYFYFSLNFLINEMPTKTMSFLLYAAILNPFFSSSFIYLAIKSIKNDEKLVSGRGSII